MTYRLVIEADAFHALLRWRAADRRYLVSILGQLASDPYTRGSVQERDETGRFIEVLLIPRFAITYWADHGARELRVARLERIGTQR